MCNFSKKKRSYPQLLSEMLSLSVGVIVLIYIFYVNFSNINIEVKTIVAW